MDSLEVNGNSTENAGHLHIDALPSNLHIARFYLFRRAVEDMEEMGLRPPEYAVGLVG